MTTKQQNIQAVCFLALVPVVVQQLTVTTTYVGFFFFETETYILGLFITDVCNAFVREKENGRQRERESREHTQTHRDVNPVGVS